MQNSAVIPTGLPLEEFQTTILDQKYLWSIADQTILSQLTSATTTFIARWMEIDQYSEYFLVYISIMLINSNLQNSLTGEPLSILSQDKKQESEYYSNLLYLQLGVSIISAFCIIGIMYYSRVDSWMSYLIVWISIFPIQIQEFFRSLFFSQINMRKALVNDATTYISRVFFFFILISSHHVHNVFLYAAMGVSSLIGVFIGFSQLSLPLRIRIDKTILMDYITFGKWLLGDTALASVSQRGLLIALAKYVQVERFGTFAACSSIMNILNIFIAGFFRIATPVAAKKYLRDVNEFKSYMKKALILGLCLVVIIGTAVVIFGQTVMSITFGPKFTDYGLLLTLALLNVISTYLASVFAIFLSPEF